MSDTKTEEESKRKEPAKKGLHGWKAATAVFGCGTLAAFGVFGVIVGILSMFLNVASSGLSSSEEQSVNAPAEQIGEARADLDEGEMDVCTDNLTPLSSINVNRQDSGENYLDTTDEGEIPLENVHRLVEDECHWEIIPQSNSTPWDFYFSYEAVIDAEGEDPREDIASYRFDDLRSGLGSDLEQVKSDSENPFGESSYSVYGVGDQGQSVYLVLVQVRSAVYQIHFEDRPEGALSETSENAFAGEARKVTNFLRNGFEYWIPE